MKAKDINLAIMGGAKLVVGRVTDMLIEERDRLGTVKRAAGKNVSQTVFVSIGRETWPVRTALPDGVRKQDVVLPFKVGDMVAVLWTKYNLHESFGLQVSGIVEPLET